MNVNDVRPIALALLLFPALALAQADEWSTFPPEASPPATPAPTPAKPAPASPPAGPKKAPATKAAPAPAPSKQQAEPATRPAPQPSVVAPSQTPASEAPVDTAQTATPAAEEAPAADVVAQEERFLPGTEPHSPSTWRNAWNASNNRRITPTVVGTSGLLDVSSAIIGPKGLLRFSVFGEYFSQRDFPVLRATNVRSAGTFAAAFAPLPWLETFLAYGAAANTNNFSSPRLIQALGDVSLGAKASREWVKGLHAGFELRLQSFSGVGNQDVSRYAFGAVPRALVSYDVRTAAPKVPVVLHGNVGFHFDGTGGLVRQHTLNASEEFALGVHRYNRFATGVGVEVPLTAVTPFLEWNLGVPLGVPDNILVAPNGATIPVSAAMPHTLALGAKVTAIKDLTLMAAVEFGLARTVGLGVPATPPYNLMMGAAFNIDPFQRGETRLVETVRERKVEQPVAAEVQTAKVEGVVVDAQTQKPIPGVIVAMVGSGLPPVASDAESGRFLTYELKPGPVTLRVEKDGYEQASQEVMLETGKTAAVQVALQPKAKLAHFVFNIVAGGKTKSPVVAEITVKGPVEHTVKATGTAEPTMLDVPPGKYLINVVAPDHLAQTREVQVSADAEMKLAFELEPQPKKKLVVVKDDKIEILQQVHFAAGKARILADSYSLLNQVVDAIVTSDVKRIRVEGHTDNRGGKKKNQILSEQRAQAVADYLINRGIDPSRIEVAGLGDSRPIAPNLTARGRELNRRVEFVILDR